MPRLTLVRYGSTPMGTFGRMFHDAGWWAYTVERPWVQNKPTVSCIPAGLYQLKLGMYYKHNYPAYELLNVPQRAGIKIHVANTYTELEGCIAPGKDLGWIGDPSNMWAVEHSKAAFDELMGLPAPENIFIQWQGVEEP